MLGKPDIGFSGASLKKPEKSGLQLILLPLSSDLLFDL